MSPVADPVDAYFNTIAASYLRQFVLFEQHEILISLLLSTHLCLDKKYKVAFKYSSFLIIESNHLYIVRELC